MNFRAVIGLAVCLVTAGTAFADGNKRSWNWNNGGFPEAAPQRDIFPGEQFTFCRVRYTSYGEHPSYNQRGRWTIDFPDSDQHFSWRLDQITTVDVNRKEDGSYKHAVVSLTDEALFDFPFIYMVEVGMLNFSDAEAEALRSYLLRGGFLMVDDFWGDDEWRNWEYEFSKVLNPIEYPMVELDLDHPIFHCVFSLDEKPQVTTPWHWMRSGGSTSERGRETEEVSYKGVFDKNNRLMAVICHNTDLGDGWEREGEHKQYFEEISVKRAYPMGINIVVYALTH